MISRAQSLEGGLFLGASNYYGDLTNKEMLGQTHPAGGLLVRYHINERWGFKGFLGYARISGADSLSGDAAEVKRNLSFYSDLFEISAQLELNLIRYNQHFYARKAWIPYLFAGLGVYNFNPKAELNGHIYELQPLGTEGQGTTTYNDKQKYNLTQFCIPFGIGVKKKIAKRWSIGIELGARYTYTNYLDDVGGTYANFSVLDGASGRAAALLSDRSKPTPQFNEGDQRGSKKMVKNDMYIIGGISIMYTFKNINIRCPKFN